MGGTTLPAEAVELYGLEPGEFVAARNALVKALKRDKRAADAATVSALRRPSPADYSINAAVRAAPDVANVWVAAVGALDDEQRAAIGGEANHLREAGAALREASARFVDAALTAVGDERRRSAVIDALRTASTRPGAAMVAAGILGAGDATDELFAGAPEPPPRPKATARSETIPKAAPSPAVAPRDERFEKRAAAAAERLAAAEAAAHAAEAALAEARAAEATARDALQAATAALRRAQTAATRADSELAAARRAAGR